MKKALFLAILLSLSAALFAMPPMPGSGLKHDGSDRQESVAYESGQSRSSSMNKIAKASSVTTTGEKTLLVILAQFPAYTRAGKTYSSLSFKAGAKTTFENLLGDYADSPATLTMAEYYKKMSRGLLKLKFKVLGPYDAEKDYAYYGVNNIYGDDTYPHVLVHEMLEQALASGEVVSGIDNCTVIVVHAGPGEENGNVSSDLIWSHRWTMSKGKDENGHYVGSVTINDKTFDDYTIVPEYNISSKGQGAAVGVFCHEFGHILGLPDSYDTSYNTAGVGLWSLMSGGSWGSVGQNSSNALPGVDPAPMMAWERVKLGWLAENNITPASSGIYGPYEFENINNASSVYRINLSGDQYLTLEGKAENMTGSGMAVMENGLLITQIHNGILDTYWSVNRINYGTIRPHGAMVVEAAASNYRSNGLGNLWRGSETAYRFTTTALFRSGTLTSVGPSGSTSSADIPFLSLFFSTMMGSGVVVSVILLLYYGRKKLCAAVAFCACATCICFSCSLSGGGGSASYDKGPTTNYYTSTSNVYSKTGNSGISIYNITVNEDGSGSFYVKKD
ncbi:MAG: M6 family metalloprotease domain-containing protein [Spirochaetia bacterium]|nr:M6 family metalloprotease domain-containing protein [Spirochaetia bacterium]MBQ7746958.1 M6 family metalloprotease domain-containing protein [Spirochaetia bacterium]